MEFKVMIQEATEGWVAGTLGNEELGIEACNGLLAQRTPLDALENFLQTMSCNVRVLKKRKEIKII